MNLSIVVAKVVRENAQYKYKLVGKGERYLVQHQEGDNSGNAVMKYLTPYAKEPVVIEGVSLQKHSDIVESFGEMIYKAVVQHVVEDIDTGRLHKSKRNYFINGDSYSDAYEALLAEANNWVGLSEIISLSKTNIIEVLYDNCD